MVDGAVLADGTQGIPQWLATAFIIGCIVIVLAMVALLYIFGQPVRKLARGVAVWMVHDTTLGGVDPSGADLFVVGFFVALASAGLGVLCANMDVYDLLWLRNAHSVPVTIVLILIGWVAPFAAIGLLRVPLRLAWLLACALLFVSAYLWTWILLNFG